MPVDSVTFRRALANMPAPVTVVTTADDEGRPWGFTASSVCSLSLDPPLVLVCIGKRMRSYPAFEAAERFTVNVLAGGQEELARRFADSSVDKFDHDDVTFDDHGLPVILGTLTRLGCAAAGLLDGGDHSILVGRVDHAPVADGPPLVYFDRDFRTVNPSPASTYQDAEFLPLLRNVGPTR
jgi:flavin reductase (DIM6/NTAB) family NADH-FMN oxidoreductase RutF